MEDDKAEKLAAARKRIEALKKKGKKKSGSVTGSDAPAASTDAQSDAGKEDSKGEEDAAPDATPSSPPPAPSQPSDETIAQLNELQKKNDELTAIIDSLRDELLKAVNRAETSESEASELKRQLEASNAALEAKTSEPDQTEELNLTITTLREELAQAISRAETAESQKSDPHQTEELNSTITSLREELGAATSRTEALESENAALRTQVEQANAQAEQTKSDFQSRLDTATTKLEASTKKVSSLERELTLLKAEQSIFPVSGPTVTSPPPAASASAPPHTPRTAPVTNHDDDHEVSRLAEIERERLRAQVKGLQEKLMQTQQQGGGYGARTTGGSIEVRRKEKLLEKRAEAEKWKGWRMDLAGNNLSYGIGPVFDV